MRKTDAHEQDLAEPAAHLTAAIAAAVLAAVAHRRASDGLPDRRMHVRGRDEQNGRACGHVRIRRDRAAELRPARGKAATVL